MKVLKFGGTSVGTVGSLSNLKSIVDSLEEPAVVVVSALGGLTDRLIATARAASEGDSSFRSSVAEMATRHFDIIDALVPQSRREAVREVIAELLAGLEDIYTGVALIRELSEKTLSRIVSFGERMSSVIVAEILDNAEHRDSLTFMRTEKWFNRDIAARQLTDDLIREAFPLPLTRTVVTGGFISLDKDTGEITNLGRGGSDYTAALIAAALDADSLEIWTDVDGFMTADPRVIRDARVIESMSFIESMELCSFGAKVIYPPTIYPVFHKNIPIRILNTFNPSAPGTLITDSSENLSSDVRGVSSVKNTCMVSVSGSLTSNVAQINSRSYNAMARNGVSIFLVAQPNAATSFSMAVSELDADRAVEILSREFAPELQNGEVTGVSIERDLSVIAVVRESIKEIRGLGARLVNTLQREGIAVKAVSDGASESTIAIITSASDTDRSLCLIHTACFG
ncbi:MAG: aspartate kinase [Muribaculaceae bacterium]|nr:aspartate kinase [Muribaculaceae bacterium]